MQADTEPAGTPEDTPPDAEAELGLWARFMGRWMATLPEPAEPIPPPGSPAPPPAGEWEWWLAG